MNLRQLSYFVTVARLESFTRAAARLYIAQPALSRAIRSLEGSLGVQLLVRHKGGVAPTSAGLRLLDRADSILRLVEQTSDDLKSFDAAPSGTVIIGSSPSVAQLLVAPVLARCRVKLPRVQLQFKSGFNRDLNEHLLDGTIDIAVMEALEPSHRQHLAVKNLLREQLHVIVPPAWGLARRRSVRLEELAKFPIALAGPERSGTRQMLEESLAALPIEKREEFRSRVVAEFETFSVAKELILRGLACTVYVPIAARAELLDGRLCAIPVQGMFVPRVLAVNSVRPRVAATAETVEVVTEVVELMKAEGVWPMTFARSRRS